MVETQDACWFAVAQNGCRMEGTPRGPKYLSRLTGLGNSSKPGNRTADQGSGVGL